MKLFKRIPKRARIEPPALGLDGGVGAPAATYDGNPKLYSDGYYVRRLELAQSLVSAYAGAATMGFIGAVAWAISLYPLKETEVIYTTWDTPETRYVRVQKGAVDRSTMQQIMQNTLKQYVKERESIDHTTEGKRFSWVRAHTEPGWFAPWFELMKRSNPQSPLEKYRKAGMTRDVFVTSLNPLADGEGQYRVEYTTVDRKQGYEVQRRDWVVVLKAVRKSIGGTSETAEMNPFGVVVSNYAASAQTLGGEEKEIKE